MKTSDADRTSCAFTCVAPSRQLRPSVVFDVNITRATASLCLALVTGHPLYGEREY